MYSSQIKGFYMLKKYHDNIQLFIKFRSSLCFVFRILYNGSVNTRFIVFIELINYRKTKPRAN